MEKASSMSKTVHKKKKDIPLRKHETNFERYGYPVNLLYGLNENHRST